MFLRWEDDAGYVEMAREFKKFVPGFVLPLVRRAQRKKLHEQGTSRHSRDEVMALGIADLAALAELLFAFLEALIPFPVDSPIKQAATRHANLVAYRDRIRARWWRDL